MSAFATLYRWLQPLLDPLEEVRTVIQQPLSIHHETVATFATLVAGLYDGPDGFQGDAAASAKATTEAYLHAEAPFSGAGTPATGTSAAAAFLIVPPAPIVTVLEEAGKTSVNCGAEITEAASNAAAEMGADAGLDTVTEAVDVLSVAQAGLDPVTDIPAAILTTIDIGLKIGILVALGWSIYNAVESWIGEMQRLGHITWPPLPSFLYPYGYNSSTPINQKLTPLQEQEVQDILANLTREGITGVSQSDVEELVRLGYDRKSIFDILRLKSFALLKYAKSTKIDAFTLKELLRSIDLAQRTIEDTREGKIRKAINYHGRLPAELEREILSNPEAIYVSKNGNFTFLKGGNIVVTMGAGSRRGAIVTSYGPGGPRGASGAQALRGGSPSDPGLPVTNDMIIKGEIPRPRGENIPPATKILP